MNPMNPLNMNSLPWYTVSRQASQRFDLPTKTSNFSHRAADRFRSRRKQQIAAMIETGCDLLAVEEQFGTDQFGDWLQTHCHIDEKTARRYMRFARFGDKVEVISELPDSILYKLGALATPEEVTRVVLAYFEAGWPLQPNEIDRLIRERKAELYAQYVSDIIG
jgi:hypothetical protein